MIINGLGWGERKEVSLHYFTDPVLTIKIKIGSLTPAIVGFKHMQHVYFPKCHPPIQEKRKRKSKKRQGGERGGGAGLGSPPPSTTNRVKVRFIYFLQIRSKPIHGVFCNPPHPHTIKEYFSPTLLGLSCVICKGSPARPCAVL